MQNFNVVQYLLTVTLYLFMDFYEIISECLVIPGMFLCLGTT